MGASIAPLQTGASIAPLQTSNPDYLSINSDLITAEQ